MEKKITQLLVFNIQNIQKDYSMCLNFIEIYEDKIQSFNWKKKKILPLILENKITMREWNNVTAYRRIEEPIVKSGQDAEIAYKIFRNNIENSIILNEKNIDSFLDRNDDLHYHIRVHMEYDENGICSGNLVHFQYLALLLKRLSYMKFFEDKLKRKLTFFLVPPSAEYYPFESKNRAFNSDIFNIVSQYLRMIAKKYTNVIWCANMKDGVIEVHTLEMHITKGSETYFPVIFINSEIYNILFDSTTNIQYYKSLKGKNKGSVVSEFGNSNARDPIKAMPDFIVKTSYKRILTIMDKNIDGFFSMLAEQSDKSIMHFCLFAFLLSKEERIENVWKLSGEIESGIRQVIQNSIQHSEIHECVFSFYLHEKNDESVESYMKRLMEQYPFFVSNSSNNKIPALEIFISDLNEKQDMLDNFKSNLLEDQKLYSKTLDNNVSINESLIINIDKIFIRNFFSEFEKNDLRDIWYQFRKQDIVAHVGLSLFSITAEKCGAAIKVVSSKYFAPPNEQNWFYKAYSGKKGKIAKPFGINGSIIPGTQFSILIPVTKWEQIQTDSLGQLDMKNTIAEDYKSFSRYLNYYEKRKPIMKQKFKNVLRMLKSSNLAKNRSEKILAVNFWETIWLIYLEEDCKENEKESVIYNHDFENIAEFVHSDQIEVCLKGLLLALSSINVKVGPLYLAITNLPKGFIDYFCKIAILIGVREFPENVQLYLNERICDKNTKYKEIVFTGKNFTQLVYNAYILSIEHSNGVCSYKDYIKTLQLHKKLSGNIVKTENREENRVDICPFDVLLHISKGFEKTLFEEKISYMAEQELDGSALGYKLSQTHMRLGSKVHIESFYEMSFLFYRTSIANRIAFLILKDLLESTNEKLDLKRDAVIFYGYASYSKAILTSLTEILRFWREKSYKRKVGFASYQHNLQSDTNEVRLYFGLESDSFAEVSKNNKLYLKEYTQIIQVVPISSTLTTFGKMWSEFSHQLDPRCIRNLYQIYRNYTIFWVIDQENKEKEIFPSIIEKKYWIREKNKMVKTQFSVLKDGGCEFVRYFMFAPVKWNDPLYCSLCFPENVIDEIPLVETDTTSTIPAQQIRYQTKEHVINIYSEEFQEQIIRLKKLQRFVLHGHIVRRKNHYQYYIDTQGYFYKIKESIKDWLIKLKEKGDRIKNKRPILHIIFSPEHDTNVGFAQYVNTYYFCGRAEIISINVDREYRSNFVCEHAGLMKMISQLHQDEYVDGDTPIRFYFVDDTIITGETFEKANSFLHSLIPVKISKYYHTNLFEKIFLLLDRLSMDTKRMYVDNMEENFHSFVHIDVPNSRTQGDSCVGCKLEKDAEIMFKRSATRVQAKYWARKLYDYRKIGYNNLEELEKIDKAHSYNRMMIYHILQNILIKNGQTYLLGDTYDVLLDLMKWLLTKGLSGNIYGYKELLEGMEGIQGIKNVLKIICRPFFTFDYKIRIQVLTLYICLTEFLLDLDNNLTVKNIQEKSSKKFLLEKERMKKTMEIAEMINLELKTANMRLEFLIDFMFEGLTEMKSTYLMRKQTFIKVYKFINIICMSNLSAIEQENFWNKYTFHIHRILSSTKDETKEFWLEYLYSTGNELKMGGLNFDKMEKLNIKEMPELYTCIVGKIEIPNNDYFKRFLIELFLQNTGINFDGIEKKILLHASDEYFMEAWNGMRKLRKWILNQSDGLDESYSENELFRHFAHNQETEEKNKREVRAWYEKLLQLIVGLGKEKYGLGKNDIDIVLMTENSGTEVGNIEEQIQHMDIISEWIEDQQKGKAITRYKAKVRLRNALQEGDKGNSLLEKVGYVLYDDNIEQNYFIIFFDNPELHRKKVAGLNLRKLARVFLYVNMNGKNNHKNSYGLRYIMRDILTYRNRLLRVLEQDFYGDTFINYARTNEERNILSHEKAASHSASTDDEIAVELFVKPKFEKKMIYQYLNDNDRAYWLLIRNYTNNQIAKLFNRSFKEEEKGEIPPLYLENNIMDSLTVFGQSLNSFEDLGINDQSNNLDERFIRIQNIMNISIELENDSQFIKNKEGFAYNLEYFKCILVDILISSIKYQTTKVEDFLLRVEELGCKNKYEKKPETKIYRMSNKNENVDYLVIENTITEKAKLAYGLIDWKRRNEKINMRMEDPLDFIDGHMSLLTIKRYIENLGATKLKCYFKYSEVNVNGDSRLIFSTYLPVLVKKGN